MTVMLYVVPYLEGDIQDDNHYRVEHHHEVGISGRYVIINGEERETKSTSRLVGRKCWPHCTILVHLKPRKRSNTHRMKCAHISHHTVLNYIRNRSGKMSMLLEFYYDIDEPVPAPRNLMLAKLRKLVARGYLVGRVHPEWKDSFRLTRKGEQLLKECNA